GVRVCCWSSGVCVCRRLRSGRFCEIEIEDRAAHFLIGGLNDYIFLEAGVAFDVVVGKRFAGGVPKLRLFRSDLRGVNLARWRIEGRGIRALRRGAARWSACSLREN